MDRKTGKIEHEIAANLDDIHTSVNTLAEFQTFMYVYIVMSQRVFDTDRYRDIENKSDFLRGALEAMSLLSELPEAFDINKV